MLYQHHHYFTLKKTHLYNNATAFELKPQQISVMIVS